MGIFDIFKKKKPAQKQTCRPVNYSALKLQQPTPPPSINSLVNEAINAYETDNLFLLQNKLFQLYHNFNHPGGGRAIVDYPRKDQLCECFTLCLQYDWEHDSDIREVWAEDGFYCVVSYLKEQARSSIDKIAAFINMIHLLCTGRNDLKPELQDILHQVRLELTVLGSGRKVPFVMEDYEEGADVLIDKLLYWAVIKAGPTAMMAVDAHERQTIINLMHNSIFKCDSVESLLEDIEEKAMFISNIIESILLEY